MEQTVHAARNGRRTAHIFLMWKSLLGIIPKETLMQCRTHIYGRIYRKAVYLETQMTRKTSLDWLVEKYRAASVPWAAEGWHWSRQQPCFPFPSAGRTENRGAEWGTSIFLEDRLGKTPLLSLSHTLYQPEPAEGVFAALSSLIIKHLPPVCWISRSAPAHWVHAGTAFFNSLFSGSLAALPPPTLHLSCLTSGDQSCHVSSLIKGHWAFA